MPWQALRWVSRPVAVMEECSKRYGEAFTISLPSEGNVVFLTDPEAVKEVFTGDPSVFHAGEANGILEPLVGRHSVLLLDEATHLRQRKLLLPPFHGRRMQRYGELFQAVTDEQMDGWPRGEPFPLRPRMQAITLEVIMRAVFGVEDHARRAELGARMARMLDLSASRFPLLVFPGLRRYDGPGAPLRAFHAALASVDAIVFDETARRRVDPDVESRDDILSVLVQARDEDGEPMSAQELRDELMTLLVAGHETTATALSWAWERLLRRPAALERLTAEVAAGEDGYLDAVVKETLRLRPVLQVVLRKLTRPTTVAGMDLPAGANVAPCIYLVHRRPDIYPEPASFRPERFLERPAETYSWIPFGGGIRRCVGASFALAEMQVVLRTMVERAVLRVPDAARHERPRRRTVTMAPADDSLVVLEELRGPARAPAGPVLSAA